MVLPRTGAERAAGEGDGTVGLKPSATIKLSFVVNVPVAMKRTRMALPVAILADSGVSGKKKE